jgi:hypothetical protein
MKPSRWGSHHKKCDENRDAATQCSAHDWAAGEHALKVGHALRVTEHVGSNWSSQVAGAQQQVRGKHAKNLLAEKARSLRSTIMERLCEAILFPHRCVHHLEADLHEGCAPRHPAIAAQLPHVVNVRDPCREIRKPVLSTAVQGTHQRTGGI